MSLFGRKTANKKASAVARLSAGLRRLFPARQVLIRTDGHVRFAPLSTGRQLLLACAGCAFLGWTGFTTAAWLNGQAAVASKQAQLAEAQADADAVRESYQQAFGRLEEYQAMFASVTCEVETIQDSLLQLADRAQGKKRGVSVDSCPNKAEPVRTIAVSHGPTTAIVASMPERESLKGRLTRLQDSVEKLKASHEAFLSRSSVLTSARIDAIEQTLSKVGLNPDSVMRRGFGQGGPFIPASLGATQATPSLAGLASLNGTIDRLDLLTDAMRSLPIAAPMAEYELTSSFGARNDPLNNLTGIHEGIDLGGPVGTPVLSTADGKVTFAGWRDRYGMLVEIEHGMGLTTRYAHLSRIHVREGQMVSRNSTVGLLGSTGRSTGPHLHYEVRVQGQARNPLAFFRAGQNVLASQ